MRGPGAGPDQKLVERVQLGVTADEMIGHLTFCSRCRPGAGSSGSTLIDRPGARADKPWGSSLGLPGGRVTNIGPGRNGAAQMVRPD